MRVGIDFGTTNSSVAYYDGHKLVPIQLDPGNENPYVLPSLIYIDREHQQRLGSAAAAMYLEQETGRKSVWQRWYMGAIEMIVGGAGSGPIRYMHEIFDMVDINANGRLLQSIKTTLRDPGYEGTVIFDRYYPLDELIALVLSNMKARAEAQLEDTCDEVVLGRPVKFSDDPAINARAEEILYKAARFAGFKDVSFQLEPNAVAYLHHTNAAARQTAFIFDFGGGTLDLTLADVGGSAPPQILATRGVLVGGDDLDRRIMGALLKYFGAGSKCEDDIDFPFDMLELLTSWQTIPDLSRPHQIERIRRYQKTSSRPQAMYALETLVSENVGFALFKIIEQTKRRLSDEILARLDFVYKTIAVHERLLRRDFEKLIELELTTVRQEILTVLNEAGLSAGQVDIVLRTGGSSLVPAFVELLADIFGHEKLRKIEPLTSVVGGMAVTAHEGVGREPGGYVERYVNPIREIRASSGRHYRPTILRNFRKAYMDRPYTLMRVPLPLSGLPAIRPADLDYEAHDEAHLRFVLERPAKVYVGYLSTATSLPRWLRAFTPEPMHLELEHPGGRYYFPIYSRDFPAGPVSLGGNQAEGCNGPAFLNYLVAVAPHI